MWRKADDAVRLTDKEDNAAARKICRKGGVIFGLIDYNVTIGITPFLKGVTNRLPLLTAPL